MKKIAIPFSVFVSLLIYVVVFGADKVVVVPLFRSSPPSTSKLIFVTDGSWSGDLGGLSGADAKCNAEAKTRNFTGTFQALLGSNEGTPERRSIHYPLPYLRVGDGEDLNSDFHDLFSSGGLNNFATSSDKFPWTGLNGNGTLTGNNCNGWSDSTSSYGGTIGWTRVVASPEWLALATRNCDVVGPIYCIEQ